MTIPAGQRWVDAIERVRAAAEHWGEGRTLDDRSRRAPTASAIRLGRGIFERSAASPADGADPDRDDRPDRRP